MTTGERLRKRRKEIGISADDVAKYIGVSRATVFRYEKGEIEKLPGSILEPLSKVLHTTPAYLMGWEDPEPDEASKSADDGSILPSEAYPYIPTHKIPILGRISAGQPLYAEEHIEGYTYTELNHGGEYFALRVRGDSMNAAPILDGQLVIVRKQDLVDDGDIAVVLVGDDEATVKRFYHTGDTVTLMPQSTNPDHKPQVYNLKNTNVRILGRVMQSQISF